MVLTSVIRHMLVLTSHILMVLSLEPDSRKGPGFPLFLVWSGTKNRRIPRMVKNKGMELWKGRKCVYGFSTILLSKI